LNRMLSRSIMTLPNEMRTAGARRLPASANVR
jgi:hypothetical protein